MEAPQLLLNWEAPRLGADPASAATPPGAGPPGAAAVFTNSLLLMEDSLRSDSSGSRGASPQSQPLKSLAAAAAEAAASRRGGADGAHLIAALPLSRAASFEEHQVCAWRAAKQLANVSGPPDGSLGRGDGSSAASSPRIGAVLLPRGGGSHGPSQLQVQPPAQHQQGMGAIFRRLSQQMLPVFGGGSGGVPAAAAAADPVAAAPQRAAAAGAAAYVELAVESSGGSSDVRGIFSHKSPAHLLAPAPPPLWAPDTSPPAVELQLVAAERSGGGSMDGTHVQQQQQEHQQHADVLDLLEAGDDLLPHAGARLQAGAADDGALAMQPQVRPLGPQPSGLSSPSSGSYSAAAASGRHLAPEAAADVFAAALGGASWQAQQQEQQQPDASGIVRRSLAGDFTACVPEQQLEQQQLASVAVPRTANGVAQPRAWSEEREHIHLDLDVLESCLPAAAAPAGSPVLLELHSPGAGAAAQAPAAPSSPLSLALLDAIPDAPSAALAGWLEAAQGAEEGEDEAEQQQLLEPLAVGTLPAGYLPSLWARYEQLDNLRRIRRAVRVSLKLQRREAAGHSTRSLLQRLSCFVAGHHGPPRLRRSLERQRLQLLCLGRLPYSPDEPLHFEAFQAVCFAFTGMDAIDEHPLEAAGDLPAWQLLGFSAANPAGELQEAGVLPLLMLLSLLERAPHLASRLLTAALGGPLQQQQQQHPCGPACLPPFRLAEVAVEVTRWALRLLGSGGLSAEAQRLGCVYSTAELFFAGGIQCFLAAWESVAAASVHGMDGRWASRLLLAVLVQAQQEACGNVRAVVMRQQRAGEGSQFS